jgi:hypothetical protein
MIVPHLDPIQQGLLFSDHKTSQTRRRRSTMKKTALLLAAAAALLATSVAAQETIAPGANVSVVFDQELPNAGAVSTCTRRREMSALGNQRT